MSKVLKVTGKIDAKKWVEENGFPEIGVFEDRKVLQKFYKQLDDEQLEEWCSIEGLEYKACPEQPPIHRMRVCMAILYKHFPKETNTSGTKKKSKYADYKTEDLIQMAVDSDVPVEITDDMKIMRMRTIMALRAAKVIE